jgi:large subunit ribosomal protein L15
MKLKKRKKSSRAKSRTHGKSAKLNKGKGSHGGKGMAGSGKRADQKKSLVLSKYNIYFGKKGTTSKKSKRKKEKFINLESIEDKFAGGEIDLSGYKILGKGQANKKFIIKAKAASKAAIKKIEKAGGQIILSDNKKTEKQEIKKQKLGKKEQDKKSEEDKNK